MQQSRAPLFLLTLLLLLCSYGPAMSCTANLSGRELQPPDYNDYPIFIVEAAWAKNIVGACPDPVSSTEELQIDRRAGLSFWMRFAGTQRAIALLADQDRLPLRHLWISPAGDVEAIDLTIKEEEYPAAQRGMRLEVFLKGAFDWRTWSKKENLSPGQWIVKIIDNKGNEVPCATAESCSFSIHLSR